MVLVDLGEDNGVVTCGGSESAGVEQVDQESALQEEVEGDEPEDDAGELIDNVKGSKTHPVGQPLLVVVQSVSLEGSETHEGGVGYSEDIGDVGLSDSEHHEGHC